MPEQVACLAIPLPETGIHVPIQCLALAPCYTLAILTFPCSRIRSIGSLVPPLGQLIEFYFIRRVTELAKQVLYPQLPCLAPNAHVHQDFCLPPGNFFLESC